MEKTVVKNIQAEEPFGFQPFRLRNRSPFLIVVFKSEDMDPEIAQQILEKVDVETSFDESQKGILFCEGHLNVARRASITYYLQEKGLMVTIRYRIKGDVYATEMRQAVEKDMDEMVNVFESVLAVFD